MYLKIVDGRTFTTVRKTLNANLISRTERQASDPAPGGRVRIHLFRGQYIFCYPCDNPLTSLPRLPPGQESFRLGFSHLVCPTSAGTSYRQHPAIPARVPPGTQADSGLRGSVVHQLGL